MMNKILLVEDNFELAKFVCDLLQAERYAVDHALRIEEARDFLLQYTYDIIILDLHLPDGDGREFCQQLRKHHNRTPILMLTGQDSVPEKISGLDSGADDYLTKPFETDELMARLRALDRRDYSQPDILLLGELKLFVASRSVMLKGKTIELARREFDLLAFLLRNPKQEFEVETLKARVWGNLSDVSGNAVMTAISRLRAKLAEANSDVEIETTSLGYRLISANLSR